MPRAVARSTALVAACLCMAEERWAWWFRPRLHKALLATVWSLLELNANASVRMNFHALNVRLCPWIVWFTMLRLAILEMLPDLAAPLLRAPVITIWSASDADTWSTA